MPAAKNTVKVARLLGVTPGTDIRSPGRHSAFRSLDELLDFVQLLREEASVPVGLKFALGSARHANELMQAMAGSGRVPDFVTLDGGDGGTGGAPTVLQHGSGLPTLLALRNLRTAMNEWGVTGFTVFVSGRIWNGLQLFQYLASGADACFVVRSGMVAMGCVQARECHTGRCPSGIAAQSRWRVRAITPEVQARQLIRFIHTIEDDLIDLLRASGLKSSREIGPEHLVPVRHPLPTERGSGGDSTTTSSGPRKVRYVGN